MNGTSVGQTIGFYSNAEASPKSPTQSGGEQSQALPC
ncbi:hypothetical protein FIU95_21575 (plasmid) [Microbulbifer sp. THAF38]|nr:hypothetical protein FIU95_21575 [Microbulbifer sp. THAF38]